MSDAFEAYCRFISRTASGWRSELGPTAKQATETLKTECRARGYQIVGDVVVRKQEARIP